ncbi:POM33 [Candida margitis]|uniref:POM33 n=1 Tax=Candida margitis TaxID=1775924 RepID=UPI002226CF45|nr:POM33 [Candida margitis]KAI5969040.1 POM33 [Candida margitis]
MPAATSKNSTPSSASSTPKQGQVDTDKLLELVYTLQFAWFVGNVLTLFGFIASTLTFLRILPSLYKLDYLLTLLGVLISFGILVFQLVQKNGLRFGILIKDDNTHYILLGGFLLFLRPYVWLTLVPFAIFSTFHVLAYVNGYILPIVGLDKSNISSTITNFVSQNNAKSIEAASGIELVTYVWLLLRMITFRKRSLSPVLVYTVFLKKRYEVSAFTRGYVKVVADAGDKIVNDVNHPVLRDVWAKVRNVFGIVDQYKLVNDYTQEGQKTK